MPECPCCHDNITSLQAEYDIVSTEEVRLTERGLQYSGMSDGDSNLRGFYCILCLDKIAYNEEDAITFLKGKTEEKKTTKTEKIRKELLGKKE